MILIDSLLIGGIRFVLDKVAQTVDAELNDDTVLRQRLLEAQMRRELGEISEDEFRATEEDVLRRLRELRARDTEEPPPPGGMRITGVEASFAGEEHEAGDEPGPRRRR